MTRHYYILFQRYQCNTDRAVNVLFVNTSEKTGGAAIAAGRLRRALEKEGVQTALAVRSGKMGFYWERASIWFANHLSREGLFSVDIANWGEDITKTRQFQEADIIHLHWVNQGFLSLKGLDKIFRSGKPVVWTMHDMWPVTGICHHARDCERYFTECHDCPQLQTPSSGDLSRGVFCRKREIYPHGRIAFVGCSSWIAGEAEKSALTTGHSITNIPNAIDIDVFRPMDKCVARQRLGLPQKQKLLLFCAQKITNSRKGMQYLVEACRKLSDEIGIIVLGGQADSVQMIKGKNVYPLKYVTDVNDVVQIYNATDVFVTPTLEDNLPNTVMEAMACGVPCVGFDIGGVPEMIEHDVTGYVASYKSADDLAQGISKALATEWHERFSEASREKVVNTYSEHVVAQRYIRLYNSLCQKH